ncbi:MAG: ABC transporter substrate-binding protein [Treponema sp.]|jgi:putative aldouronate transport system substrate-binding protein|nr:ABC transporter substrate-binding protein [Treponema sp.]
MKKALAFTLALLCVGTWAFAAARNQRSSIPTLVWYALNPEDPEDVVENLRIMSDYTQEKIGIRFETRPYAADRIQLVASSGEAVDITWIGAFDYERFQKQGVFADITDLLSSQTPALWNYVPQMLWNGAKIDGKIYAVPAYKDTSSTLFGFLDARYARKYNINTNFTRGDYIREMDAAFRAIKAGEGSQFYPMYLAKGGIEVRYWIGEKFDDLGAGITNLMGVQVDDPNRRVVSILEQPEVREALRIVHRWYQDGIINPDAPQIEQGPRGVPFTFDQAWPSKAVTIALQQGIEEYIPIQLTRPLLTTHSIRGSMLAVGANSRYKTEALKFIELINTDHKFRDMLAYGIEGKHFNYVSPNVIHRLTDTYLAYEWAQGTFFNLSVPDNQPANTWDQVRSQNETALASVLNGFSMDISPVQNEISNILAAVQQYYPDLSIGVTDPDVAIPQLLAAIRNVGFDRVMAEAQRQIDAFSR